MLWIAFSTKVESEAASHTTSVRLLWRIVSLILCQQTCTSCSCAEEVDARYVKIDLPDTDCLQLGEVEIYGHPSSQAFPEEAIDYLTVGEVFVQDVWITNRKDCW